MTTRIYYTDAHAREFDAKVVSALSHDGRPAVILDKTAFYPTSGGQPHDTGSLGAATVVEVVDRKDGEIVHVLDRAIEPGAVTGRIDWDRRFEHMQQHTGQHVLSAASEKVLGARTRSFHLGAERSTIDLSRDLSPGDIARVEQEANQVIWQNRPVTVRFVGDAEAASLPLRKEPTRTGRLRIVEVADYDLSACGGTHVDRTGAIGVVVVSGTEKYKGGARLEFVCGVRALRTFDALRDAVAGCVRQLSVLPGELPDAIARLQADGKDLQRTIKSLQESLAAYEAQAMVARAAPAAEYRIVAESASWDAAGLKALALAVTAQPRVVAVLFNPSGGLAVIARSADVRFDSAAALKALTTRFGGRGGGRPELAQAGGLDGAAEDVLEAARQVVGTYDSAGDSR